MAIVKWIEDNKGRTWEASIGRFRIVVTRHRDHDPDAWLLCCRELGIDLRQLESKDIDSAKSEAICKIHDTLSADMAALGGRFER
jgi:hypothetical protein